MSVCRADNGVVPGVRSQSKYLCRDSCSNAPSGPATSVNQHPGREPQRADCPELNSWLGLESAATNESAFATMALWIGDSGPHVWVTLAQPSLHEVADVTVRVAEIICGVLAASGELMTTIPEYVPSGRPAVTDIPTFAGVVAAEGDRESQLPLRNVDADASKLKGRVVDVI